MSTQVPTEHQESLAPTTCILRAFKDPVSESFIWMIYKKNKYFSLYLEGIEGAAEDEQAIVSQWGNHGQVGGVANEVDLADAGVVMDHL